jgi:hypothetical protein
MIGQKITFSKESRRQIIIGDLQRTGVHEGSKGESLNTLDYSTLRSMLSVKQAVNS